MEPGARRLKWILLSIFSIIKLHGHQPKGRNDFNWVALASSGVYSGRFYLCFLACS